METRDRHLKLLTDTIEGAFNTVFSGSDPLIGMPADDTFSFNGTDMTRPEMLRSVETVRRITIAEKIR